MENAMPAVKVDERERENESRRVVVWRRTELERAGFDRVAAEGIAERLDIDLHAATDLLRHGCPVETALEILL